MLFLLSLFFYISGFSFFKVTILKGFYCFSLGVFIGNVRFWVGEISQKAVLYTCLELLLLLLLPFILVNELYYKSIYVSVYFSIVIFLFSYEQGAISRLLKNKVFITLGELSYSIYLTHYVIIYVGLSIVLIASKYVGIEFTEMIDGERYINFGSVLTNNLLVVSILVATIVFSFYTHKFIEKPAIAIGKKMSKRIQLKKSKYVEN